MVDSKVEVVYKVLVPMIQVRTGVAMDSPKLCTLAEGEVFVVIEPVLRICEEMSVGPSKVRPASVLVNCIAFALLGSLQFFGFGVVPEQEQCTHPPHCKMTLLLRVS